MQKLKAHLTLAASRLMLIATAASFSQPLSAGASQQTSDFSVANYGACADGSRLATAAVQKAIEACSAAGGGRVFVPPGEYLIGTVHLRSNTELYLEAGARLIGSTRIDDYDGALIRADNSHDVSIAGRGTIDGSGAAFWGKVDKLSDEALRLKSLGGWVPAFAYWPKKRPEQMIRFYKCTNVRMSDVRLENSSAWTVHPRHCDNVYIQGVTIRNPNYGSNTDGIDIDACQDVRVSDCDISTGDDAIVLKNTNYDGPARTERNIVITNCIIDTTCNAFKIGTETSGDFENITFSNSVIRAGGEWGPLAGLAIEMVDGSSLRNVAISNIVMDGARSPVFIRLGNRGRGQKVAVPGSLQNVSIDNVVATNATLPSPIAGLPGHLVENVSISNVRVSMTGGGAADLRKKAVPEVENHYPESLMFGWLPAFGFYCRHVKGITFNNVKIVCTQPDAREMFVFDDVFDAEIDGVRKN